MKTRLRTAVSRRYNIASLVTFCAVFDTICRKSHLLDGKQISSVEVFDEVSFYTLFRALGWILEEIHLTWAHLEKKRTRFQLYTKVDEDIAYWYEMDIQEQDKKKAKNKQSRARNGKDKVKPKPKSVKVRKSTPTKSKVNQVKKIQLEGLKLPNLKLYY
ncbi:hypothetical protein Tco_0564993 [Tanacetum coccineum]